jgi:hypothetical protein
MLTCSSSYIISQVAIWSAADGLQSLALSPVEIDESCSCARKSYRLDKLHYPPRTTPCILSLVLSHWVGTLMLAAGTIRQQLQ